MGCGTWSETPQPVSLPAPVPCVVEVPVSADAPHAQRQAISDEFLWLHAARAAGWNRSDVVVRQRLAAEMRKVWGSERSDTELFEEALSLGLDATDPIARSRLVMRARRTRHAVDDPGDTLLTEHLAAHADRWMVPERRRLSRHRARDEADARALRQALVTGASIDRWTEPLLVSGESTWTHAALGGRWGTASADAVFQAELGEWSEPISTGNGWHVLRVDEVLPSKQPPLADVRAAVLAHWKDAEGARREAAYLATLRETCTIRWAEGA
jgi:hypothetical protein